MEARIALPSMNMDRVVAILWSIWKTRNSVVFRNENSNQGITLIRTENASNKWRIRHSLSKSI